MNRVCLTGRLTRDPEIKLLETGNLCSFTIAFDLGKNQSAFLPCKCFGEKADLMAKTLRKGSLIAIDGRLDQSVYEQQDGTNKVITAIVVQGFDFLEKKKEESETQENKSKTPEEIYKELDLPDDDLPF